MAFKDEYQVWLADGFHTLFSTMTRWMSYGKGFRRKEERTAKVFKAANCYPGVSTTVQAGVNEADALLDELIFDVHCIIDTLVYKGPGRSFAMNERND
jgi:hypothetical protein